MILMLMSLAHGRELHKCHLGADWRAAYRTDGIPGVFFLHFVPLSALGAFARSQPAIVTVKDLSCRCNNSTWPSHPLVRESAHDPSPPPAALASSSRTS